MIITINNHFTCSRQPSDIVTCSTDFFWIVKYLVIGMFVCMCIMIVITVVMINMITMVVINMIVVVMMIFMISVDQSFTGAIIQVVVLFTSCQDGDTD